MLSFKKEKNLKNYNIKYIVLFRLEIMYLTKYNNFKTLINLYFEITSIAG